MCATHQKILEAADAAVAGPTAGFEIMHWRS